MATSTSVTDKNRALLRAGMSPTAYGMRKGSQPHWDRKRAAKQGQSKHKSREWC